MSATAIPIPPQLITGFKKQRRSFIIHNGNRKPKTVMYGGTMMTVPPINIVGARAARDADGDPIPGTYVMQDIFVFVPELGDDVMTFDAEKAICHVLGIDRGKDGEAVSASGSYALGGMSMLMPNATKEEWQGIARAGEYRAYLADVELARMIVSAHDESNQKRRMSGGDPLPPSPEVDRAKALLVRYYEETKSQIAQSALPADFEQQQAEEELEISAIAEAIALKMAEKVAEAQGVDSVDLFKRLMDDPKVRAFAQREFRIRRRGHQPINADKLKQAADAGKTISEAGLEES